MTGCRQAIILGFLVFAMPAWAETPFSFTGVVNLTEMQDLIRQDFPVGTTRDAVRAALVDQGGATLKLHPTQKGVEKYIYDINL